MKKIVSNIGSALVVLGPFMLVILFSVVLTGYEYRKPGTIEHMQFYGSGWKYKCVDSTRTSAVLLDQKGRRFTVQIVEWMGPLQVGSKYIVRHNMTSRFTQGPPYLMKL